MDHASLYTYFDNLHALHAALIVDSHQAPTAAIAAADEAADDHGSARVRACVRAYRQWAVDHRAQLNLIFTDLIPGYVAPADAASLDAELEQGRVMLRALGLATNHHYGELEILTADGLSDLMGLSGLVHGLVALEVNNHMPFITTPNNTSPPTSTGTSTTFERDLSRRRERRSPRCWRLLLPVWCLVRAREAQRSEPGRAGGPVRRAHPGHQVRSAKGER